ncbi:MAG: GNAT family N-acetyltransferase [Betaproteobacteria bacterium]|nr:GNAT family N-acetyltransferase [Betaproteobacteria bacterium]
MFCSLGISVVSRAHGQGVGTTLMARLTEFADKWTTYLRIELTVFSDN